MTKDEADEKVREAEAELATALMSYGDMAACYIDMVEKVRAARYALAALDKPRLMKPGAVFVEVDGKYWCVPELIEVDRKHILAQAEKLPRHKVTHRTTITWADSGERSAMDMLEDAILLSDLRNLIQGT